jgi:hypothetical protein
MRFEVVSVTPDMAKEWLAENDSGNRSVSLADVFRLSADMSSGQYELTHQGIAFNKSGVLIDGQHRLRAVVKSGCTVRMVICRDVDASVHAAIDLGRKRSLGFVTGLGSKRVAVCRALAFLCGGAKHLSVSSWSKAMTITINEKYRDSLDTLMPLHKPRVMPSGLIASLVFCFPLNASAVARFGEQVRSGELLERGQAAFALRKWLLEDVSVHAAELVAMVGCFCLERELSGKPCDDIKMGTGSFKAFELILEQLLKAGHIKPHYIDVDAASSSVVSIQPVRRIKP